MNKRLPFALIFVSGAWLYACSSSDSSSDNTPKPSPDGGQTQEDGGNNPQPGDDSGTPQDDGGTTPQDDGGTTPTDDGGTVVGNPLEGAKATLVLDVGNGAYVDSVRWKGDNVYFTLPSSTPSPVIVQFPAAAPDKTVEYLTRAAGDQVLGITFDGKNDKLLFASSPLGQNEVGTLVRAAAGSTPKPTPTTVATTFADAGTGWHSPNDAVVRKSDGTIYVTDPGYQSGNPENGVYRVSPNGTTSPVELFDVVNPAHPNGIGLSPKSDVLYVTLTQNPDATDAGVVLPSIVKYEVKADGSTGPRTKFFEFTSVKATPDGLTVDTAGNVYVATADGVQVFSPAGAQIGSLATPKNVHNVSFGGTDGKTLYIAAGGAVYSAPSKVAGLVQ